MGLRRLFLAAYACSGLAALIYEVCWTRLLTLYVGHTTAAASTVVAAFMGGLAAGSFAGGRWAPGLTRRQALSIYIALELLVALIAIVLPFELSALIPLLASSYDNGSPGAWFAAIRLLLCLAILFVPAFALGVTFPIAVRWYVNRSDGTGRAGGVLYAVNTAGAAIGALMAGFVMIPAIGVKGTSWVGVAASAAVAGALLLLLRTPDEAAPAAPVTRKRSVRTRERITVSDPAWLAATALGVSGFAALLYEIVWTRLLSMIVGPTTYAFAAAVAAVITGTALGSLAGSVVAGRTRRPALWLALTLAAGAIAAIASGSLAGNAVPRLVAHALAESPTAFNESARLHALQAASLMLPVAVALGAAFPLAFEMVGTADAPAARRFSVVYALNTVGAVAGSLVAGYVAIPRLGLERTVDLVGLLLIASAVFVVVAARMPMTARAIALGPIGIAAALIVTTPGWDRDLLASGVYKYAPYVDKSLDLETALEAGTLVYYREGAGSTVAVRRLTGRLSLAVDGKVDASNGGDMLTQKLLAHVPLLMHPNPRDVLVIGLGSGVTLGSALVHPVERADVVEISPEVVEASRYFVDDNRNALADPRAHLIVGDGRSHLLLSSRTYDAIISEPSNPWMAGVASLFTREFFIAARRRLAPGGIICQWAHTYDIGSDDLRSIVATFLSVFPDATLWLIGESDVLLVASNGPLDAKPGHVDRAWQRPGVAADLRTVSVIEPFEVLSLRLAEPGELARYANNAALQVDDRMALEFSGPRAVSARPAAENVAQLRAALADRTMQSASAVEWRNRAAMFFAAEDYSDAFNDYTKALTLDPTDVAALDGFVKTAVATRRERQAFELLTLSSRARPQIPAVWIALSRLHAAGGATDEAIAAARQACDIRPVDPAALEQLASIYADASDAARLQLVVEELQRRYPERAATWYYAAAQKFVQQRLPEALPLAERAVATDPRHAASRNLLGAIHAGLGHPDEARAAFEAALRLNARDTSTYLNLGLLEMSAQNRGAAAAHFAEALSLDPGSVAARQALAEARP